MGDVEKKLEAYEVKREGEAEILMLKTNAVFFNPVQVHNRDMSIAVLRTFVAKRKEEHEEMINKRNKSRQHVSQVPKADGDGTSSEQPASSSLDGEINGDHGKELHRTVDKAEGLSTEATHTPSWKRIRELNAPVVLEALAASGLRSLRYAREIDGLGKVVALDNDEASVEACKRNIKFNGSAASDKVEAHLADARVYMLTHPKEFDVVDLDPYGSPAIFLDSAVQAVADGGLLMCTATDMAVLCGSNGEVCYSKYGSYPVKGKYCHEMALRILLACIESHANRYKRFIVPVLSVSMDFYIRVFVRVFTSASEIKNAPLKLSYVYQCVGCDSFHLQCLGRTVTKELHDVQLFFSQHNITGTVKCTPLSAAVFRSAVLNAGYRISSTHVNPLGLKSDAPWDVIWDIIRCWVRIHPIKEQPQDSAGTMILSKSPKLEANFSRAVAAVSNAQAKKINRFLPNPQRYWGPKIRGGRTITSKHASLLGHEAVNGVIRHEDGNGLVVDKLAPGTEEGVSRTEEKSSDDECVTEQ